MAPLTVELISDSLSRQQNEQFNLQDCTSRANIASVGAFFVGLSGGSAFQVHFRNRLPRSIRAIGFVPLVCGYLAARLAHDHFHSLCARDWIASGQTPFNIEDTSRNQGQNVQVSN